MDEVFARRDMIAPDQAEGAERQIRPARLRPARQPSRRARCVGRSAFSDLGKLARRPGLRHSRNADQFPLCGPARAQPLDGVQDQEAQRDIRSAVRLRPALPARFRSDPAFRPSSLYAGLGERRRAGARALHAGLLSPLGARPDLLVHAGPADHPLRVRRRDRALYPRGPQGRRHPRGALASRRLRPDRRSIARDG